MGGVVSCRRIKVSWDKGRGKRTHAGKETQKQTEQEQQRSVREFTHCVTCGKSWALNDHDTTPLSNTVACLCTI